MSEVTEYRADATRLMSAGAAALYRAWTSEFDTWFATPGTMRMRPEIGAPFYFDVDYGEEHHHHYGRFLALSPDRLVELAWVTGRGGTDGAETRVLVELEPRSTGTQLTLAHTGFYTRAAARAAHEAWPHVLAHLDREVTSP